MATTPKPTPLSSSVNHAAKLCGRLGISKQQIDPKELGAAIRAAEAVFAKAQKLGKAK